MVVLAPGQDPLRAVRAERVLMGPDLEPVAGGWMTFDGDRIEQAAGGSPPPGVLDLGEGTLIPGLVDCHVHLSLSGSADIPSEVAELTPAAATLAAVDNAVRQLLSGVTTVRDLGSYRGLVLELAAAAKNRCLVLPTIVAATAIVRPGGHGHFLGESAQGAAEFRRAAHDAVGRGARALKVFATGGVITPSTVPGAPQMDPEELASVVEVAQKASVPVAAHAHGSQGIVNAARAGVDSIEHFSYLDEASAAIVKEAGSTLVSTLVATERFVGASDIAAASPETVEKIREHAPHERAALRLAVREGLALVAGTDAGTTFNPHGGGMAEQAVHLARAGLSAAAVLATMTRHAASLLREPAGSLEPGLRADCLFVAGNPLSDLAALASPRAVIASGRLAAWDPNLHGVRFRGHSLPGARERQLS